MAVEVIYRRRRGRKRPPAEVRVYERAEVVSTECRTGLLENGLPADADLREVYLDDRAARTVRVL